jgi:hypothetical protein
MLTICRLCGGVQRPASAKWKAAATEIYRDYALYSQSRTKLEQLSFDQLGNSLPRSELALRSLVNDGALPEGGRFLDVGAGNGALSRAVGNVLPRWHRFAYEPNLREPEQLSKIGVEQVYNGRMASLDGCYDAIGFFQVLEHIAEVDDFLADVRRLCNQTSRLFIQVPYHIDNPFDILIADHCNHFTPSTFERTLSRCGLSVVRLDTAVIAGNITAICVPSSLKQDSTLFDDDEYPRARAALDASVDWLERTLQRAKDISAACDHFAIFGTSIGGTWLASELGAVVKLFVDEDPSRTNASRLGIPVLAPQSIADNTDVFVSLPGRYAKLVAQRLDRPGVRFHFLDGTMSS